jgi:hypothetical protein
LFGEAVDWAVDGLLAVRDPKFFPRPLSLSQTSQQNFIIHRTLKIQLTFPLPESIFGSLSKLTSKLGFSQARIGL